MYVANDLRKLTENYSSNLKHDACREKTGIHERHRILDQEEDKQKRLLTGCIPFE